MDAKAADRLVDAIVALIEDDLPDIAWEKAPDLFDGIVAKAQAIGRTISERNRCTDNQAAALENMKAAVEKWIH